MAPRRWGRRRGVDDGALDAEPDNVDLSGAEHAWWAGRDELGGVPEGQQGSSRRRGRPAATDNARPASGFEGYFSAESLFQAGEDEDVDPRVAPHAVLGIGEEASWELIVATYKTQAKALHPDRMAGASDAERAESERAIRDLNIAYTELRQRHGR